MTRQNKTQEERVRARTESDQPTLDDSLGFEPYVKAVAEFLASPDTKPPLTLSVEGVWGTGKSSFMFQLEEALKERTKDEKNKPLMLWFNPWRHDKEEALWAAFALKFLTEIRSGLKFHEKFFAFLRLFNLRYQWGTGWFNLVRAVLFGIGILFVVVAGGVVLYYEIPKWFLPIWHLFQEGDYAHAIRLLELKFVAFGGSLALLATVLNKFLSIIFYRSEIDLKKHLKTLDYRNRVSFVERFHEDFDKIVKVYVGERTVYVFIDDLDRCEIPKAADLMQSLNLMIGNNPQVVFIIGMDREKVAAGLAAKHEKLLKHLDNQSDQDNSAGNNRSLKYGYGFVERFVQLPFTVPQPEIKNLEVFLDKLAHGTGKEEKEKQLSKTSWFVSLKRWIRNPFSRKSITSADGLTAGSVPGMTPQPKSSDDAKMEQEKIRVLTGSDSPRFRKIVLEVSKTLDNNPRRIKQFVNLFRLRAYISYHTGLFDGEHSITLEQLGKFVALSLKLPNLLADIRRNYFLLGYLQDYALGSKYRPEPESKLYSKWKTDGELIDFLRLGIFDDEGNVDEKERSLYSLENVDVGKLLQVSPEVTHPEPEKEEEPPPPAPEKPAEGAEQDYAQVKKELSEDEAVPVETGVPKMEQRIAEPSEAKANTATEIEALLKKGDKAILSGEQKLAIGHYEQARTQALAANSPFMQARALGGLATSNRKLGENDLARSYYDQALTLCKQTGDKITEANVFFGLGELDRILGERETARNNYLKARELYRAEGKRLGEADVLLCLGELERILGENETARSNYRQARELYKAEGNRLGEANVFLGLGELEKIRGENETARSNYRQARELYKAVGDRLGEANVLKGLGDLESQLGEHETARSNFQKARELYKAVGDRLGEAHVFSGLGQLESKLGENEIARNNYRQELELYKAEGSRLGEANALLGLGRLARVEGENKLARDYLSQATLIYSKLGDRLGQANVYDTLGDLAVDENNLKDAEKYYRQASSLFKQEGFVKEMEVVEKKIASFGSQD